jgi:hypothetical protein
MDKRAETQWEKSNISYSNYRDYLNLKIDRYELTLIDLLFISNFKGGNATINEQELTIKKKLSSYSKGLRDIGNEYNGKTLGTLTNEQLENLVSKVLSICNLTDKDNEMRIDGFSVSYLSALLSAYFPILLPILDRRILINLQLVTSKNIDTQGQIKNIQQFYKPLIKKIAKISRETGQTVREIDKNLFAMRIVETTSSKTKDELRVEKHVRKIEYILFDALIAERKTLIKERISKKNLPSEKRLFEITQRLKDIDREQGGLFMSQKGSVSQLDIFEQEKIIQEELINKSRTILTKKQYQVQIAQELLKMLKMKKSLEEEMLKMSSKS